MLYNSFPNFKCQIQSRKINIFLLQLLHDSERLQIVFKSSVRFHHFVEHVLT